MKNVTITLSKEVARWIRVWAAKHDTSVSRMVGIILKEKMDMDKNYIQSMESFLAVKPRNLRVDKKNP